MKRLLSIISPALCFCAAFVSCSGPKEEVKPAPLQTPPPVLSIPAPERVFRYEDRYFVRNASIDSPANITEPLQAIRVIQLKPGANSALVISSFEKTQENGEETATESWFGIEMPSFASGVYDVSKAVNVSFYRFSLGKSGKRYDGKAFKGVLAVETAADGYIIGTVDVIITGETKSFNEPAQEFTTDFRGSFRIKEVPVEAVKW